MTWQANNAAVMTCSSCFRAQGVVTRLIEGGYATGKISVAARWSSTERKALACYNLTGRTEGWGEKGRLWARLWGALSGRGVFALPQFGPILAAGPLVEWIVRALKNAEIFGGFSAVGAALYGIGVSRDVVPEIEASFEEGDFLVIVYGTAKEIDTARLTFAAEELSNAA